MNNWPVHSKTLSSSASFPEWNTDKHLQKGNGALGTRGPEAKTAQQATSNQSLDKHLDAPGPTVPAFLNTSNKLSLISAQNQLYCCYVLWLEQQDVK